MLGEIDDGLNHRVGHVSAQVRDRRRVEEGVEAGPHEVGEDDHEKVPETPGNSRAPLHDRQRDKDEASGDQFQTQQEDHRKADREEHSPDNGQARLGGGGQCDGRRRSEDSPREHTPDRHLSEGQSRFEDTGMNNVVDELAGLNVRHLTVLLEKGSAAS